MVMKALGEIDGHFDKDTRGLPQEHRSPGYSSPKLIHMYLLEMTHLTPSNGWPFC